MLELYNFPPSTCSLKVRICLAEKDLEWVDHRLDSRNHDHLKPEYLKLNPNGVVPTLVHDGNVIIDSSVILEYLDEVFPEVRLSPDDAVGRAHMRKWLRFFEEVPTPAVRYPSFHKVLLTNYASLSDAELDAEAEKRPLKTDFYKAMGTTGFSDAEINKAMRDMQLTVARMEGALGENGGPWLLGGMYSLADICVAPLLDRMEDLGYEALWEKGHPNVTAWMGRMRARPAYAKAYYKGARFSDIYPGLRLGRAKPRPAA